MLTNYITKQMEKGTDKKRTTRTRKTRSTRKKEKKKWKKMKKNEKKIRTGAIRRAVFNQNSKNNKNKKRIWFRIFKIKIEWTKKNKRTKNHKNLKLNF